MSKSNESKASLFVNSSLMFVLLWSNLLTHDSIKRFMCITKRFFSDLWYVVRENNSSSSLFLFASFFHRFFFFFYGIKVLFLLIEFSIWLWLYGQVGLCSCSGQTPLFFKWLIRPFSKSLFLGMTILKTLKKRPFKKVYLYLTK